MEATVSHVVKEEKKVAIKADFLHKSFLLSATYKTALLYNNSLHFEGEFLLNKKN